MSALRILIADDHEVVREGTRLLVEREPGWEVCAMASSGREAIELAKRTSPDIAVLDLHMPDLNGLEAARKIKRLLPKTEVLMFTSSDDEEVIREVFEAGAKSYIRKTDASSHLLEALRALAQHKPFFTGPVAEVIFAKFLARDARQSKKEATDLTPREREILRLVAEGKSNKDVADALGISLRTAETHRANVMRKLGFSSLSELVRYAIRHQIIAS